MSYTDNQKAFHPFSHYRLIKPLAQQKKYNDIVSWFNEYLNRRTQKV